MDVKKGELEAGSVPHLSSSTASDAYWIVCVFNRASQLHERRGICAGPILPRRILKPEKSSTLPKLGVCEW